MKARDYVPRCRCGHAMQVHRATAAPACNGQCFRHEPHQPADHVTHCSVARCYCDRFTLDERLSRAA